MSIGSKFRKVAVVLVCAATVALVSGGCLSAPSDDGAERLAHEPDRAVAWADTAPEPLGPTGVRYGVPVGWRHDVAGAEAAAAAFVESSGMVVTAGRLDRRDALLAMSTAEFGPTHVEVTNRTLDDLSGSLVDRGLRQSDLLWSEHALTVDSTVLSDDEVEVQVWSVIVVALDGSPVARQVWHTSTLSMRWVDGDWKVDAWSEEMGPVPSAPAEVDVSAIESIEEVTSWARVPSGGTS
jgi:hypothetical protein